MYFIFSNKGFEERFYNASHWITVDVGITRKKEVIKALWKLISYTKGANEESMCHLLNNIYY